MGYLHLRPDTRDVLRTGREWIITDVGTRPGIGKRPVTGHFPIMSLAAARPEGLSRTKYLIKFIRGQTKTCYFLLAVKCESVNPADLIIYQIA